MHPKHGRIFRFFYFLLITSGDLLCLSASYTLHPQNPRKNLPCSNPFFSGTKGQPEGEAHWVKGNGGWGPEAVSGPEDQISCGGTGGVSNKLPANQKTGNSGTGTDSGKGRGRGSQHNMKEI
jgi:hypothetical protein